MTVFVIYSCLLSLYLTAILAVENKNVILLGDSLMNRPYNDYGLADKLDSFIIPDSGYNFTYVNQGQNGNKIADIKARLTSVLVGVSSTDYVLLFWDSDCSDVDESSLTNEEVADVRANYTANLQDVISQIQVTTKYLAVAGPEILGEGPIGYEYTSCSRFYNKTSMLDTYRDMTRSVATSNGLNYIDMRKAFLDEIPEYWPSCSGWVTKDGEHPNDRGTTIEADLFADQINSWLYPGPGLRSRKHRQT